MRRANIAGLLLLVSLVFVSAAIAGWNDWVDALKESQPSMGAPSAVSGQALTQAQMAGGLKEALDLGVQHAIQQLGRPGGFLDDQRVRIPMPEKLSWLDGALRKVGQEQLADDFLKSMNGAAEQAVPEVAAVFGNAIRDMSLDDAQEILSGPDDAATQYLRRQSSDEMAQRIKPIVTAATGETGVTSYYKSMMNNAGGLASFLGSESVDLDNYVTDKAMDGLFLMIAEQEKQIRENPLERSTDLLKKVFSAY